MKFLVDAQLPQRLTTWLNQAGCDALHTLDLLTANRTTDAQIIDFADQDQRVVVSKDADSVNTHLLTGKPAKLLLISTGNISNREHETLLRPLITTLMAEIQIHSFLELGRAGIIVRGQNSAA